MALELTDILNTANNTAGTVLTALGKGKPAAAPAAAPAATIAPAPTTSWTKYLPWMIGGGVVLLILAVILGRK